MNTTKRLFALLVVLVMVLCFAACGEGNPTTAPVATTTQPAPTTTVPVPTTTAAEAAYSYRIRVVDQDGNPIEGAYVIFCLEQCNFYATNAEGWALIDAQIADGYQAHIMSLPAGYEDYTFSEEYTTFESGQTEMVLVATKNAG